MTYADLAAALHIFGFSEHDQLTAAQIRRRHRDLVKASHPDLPDQLPRSGSTIRQINAAAAILSDYVASYRITFSEDEFYRQNPDERLRMQFDNDPVWGGR